jgi:hypothetical protein
MGGRRRTREIDQKYVQICGRLNVKDKTLGKLRGKGENDVTVGQTTFV